MKIRTIVLAAATAAALATAASAADAKDITLTINDDQQKALIQLLDIAVKSGGLGIAQNAGFFYGKILEAQNPPVAEPAPTKTAPVPAK